jgi:centrosomal protein CEP104
LDYLGDSNQKLREKTEKIIFLYAKKTKSGNKIINLIINTPIKKNLIKSRNHLNGRYLMVAKIVNFCGYMKNNFENIIKYAVHGYSLNKINVRDAALEIISLLYKYEGEKVHQYFQDSGLRPAQIKTIQDKLDEIDTKKKNKENENNNTNKGQNYEGNSCEFCGYYKPDMTKDELNIHQYKDCPLLMQCNNCKQIIEISNLNNHLLTECDFKDKYIKCEKCKQVVDKDGLNEHQNSENCFDVNEEKEKLCPLCHLNIILDDIWKIHFLENGCQNNIRTNTPSTTNASNY